jgi:hypothetical protein
MKHFELNPHRYSQRLLAVICMAVVASCAVPPSAAPPVAMIENVKVLSATPVTGTDGVAIVSYQVAFEQNGTTYTVMLPSPPGEYLQIQTPPPPIMVSAYPPPPVVPMVILSGAFYTPVPFYLGRGYGGRGFHGRSGRGRH